MTKNANKEAPERQKSLWFRIAVDTIRIEHIRQRHDAFQFVNIRPVDDRQDIETVLNRCPLKSSC
jgi:hypothetical protein